MFDLGDTVRLTADCADPAGTLMNADSVTLTVALPDGTTETPSVTNPPAVTGRYEYDFLTEQAGRHSVRWVFTNSGGAYTDVFDVREAAPPMILSLAEAKRQLNITGTSSDEEIRGWIESVTAGIQQFTGISIRATFSEEHNAPWLGIRSLPLRRTPVISVTSVVPVTTGGTSYVTADLHVDRTTGVLRRANGGAFFGPQVVTYEAGRTVIPANILSAAKIILQHLWRTQRGSRGPVVGGGDDYQVTEQVPGFGYAIPNRALQLMEPDRLPPGVA
jgi:hypothetical protein